MSDELTRAIADKAAETIRAVDGNHTMGAGALGDEIAAALVPLIEARVREARAEELEDVAGSEKGLEPERVDLMAEAICPRIAGSCDFCKSAARRIIARPEEVLSGLVRADVATREWRGDEYRYVTPWKEIP